MSVNPAKISHRTQLSVFLAVVASCLISVASAQQSPSTQPQTTQPGAMSHESALAQVRAVPLLVAEYKNTKGENLSDAEKAEIDETVELMEIAGTARETGDYVSASDSARRAFGTRRRILGESHHLTVSAEFAARMLSAAAAGSPSRRESIAAADKQFADAERLHKDGEYLAAEAAAEQAVKMREGLFGKDSVEVADALRVLGNAQIELRRLESAETTLERALRINETLYGKAHPQTGILLDRIGWLQINQRNYRDATSTFRRAGRILTMTVGETAETAEILDNLGTSEIYIGQVGSALRNKLRALVIREQVFGPEHTEVGVSYSNLAWLYSQAGQQQYVIPLRNQALAIFRKALGDDHPYVALETSNLAREYEVRDQLVEALTLRTQMVERDDRRKTPPDARSIGRKQDLGLLFLRTDKMEDAKKILDKARDQALSLYEQGDVSAATEQLESLANLYERGFRMLTAAQEVLIKLRTVQKKHGSQFDEGMLKNWFQLANLDSELGQAEEAEHLLQETLTEGRRLFADDPLKLASTLLLLCQTQQKLGRLKEAGDSAEELLQISEKKLPPKAMGKLFALVECARVFVLQKRTDMAKFLIDEAITIAEANREKRPQGWIETQRVLAEYHEAQGAVDEALAARRECLETIRRIPALSASVQLRGRLALVIKELLDTNEGKALKAAERDELTKELKSILLELREKQALSAENKQWLKELGE